MEFEQFAQMHGLIIDRMDYGVWVRCPTEDHPRKKNGAFKHLGDVAFVQNHATMPEPAIWHPEAKNEIRIDREAIARRKAKADQLLKENRQKAAKKAAWIVSQCKPEQHAYLDSKSFPRATGLVWHQSEENNLLVIPMRINRNLVGCQLIDRKGEKKFLFGQECSGAEYVIDAKGQSIWCEGYATGLSIRECLHAMKIRYTIHICFSAGNMEKMAKAAGCGFIIADNDESGQGERSAKATGLPYWISPNIGEDFNDYWIQRGTLHAGMELKQLLTNRRR